LEHLLEHVFTTAKEKGTVMPEPTPSMAPLTVVLVHGAFAAPPPSSPVKGSLRHD
jgi:hypothetical protein